jgi:hypothetical protein
MKAKGALRTDRNQLPTGPSGFPRSLSPDSPRGGRDPRTLRPPFAPGNPTAIPSAVPTRPGVGQSHAQPTSPRERLRPVVATASNSVSNRTVEQPVTADSKSGDPPSQFQERMGIETGLLVRHRKRWKLMVRSELDSGGFVVVRSPRTGREAVLQLLAQDDRKLWTWRCTVCVRDAGDVEKLCDSELLSEAWQTHLTAVKRDAPVVTIGEPTRKRRRRKVAANG